MSVEIYNHKRQGSIKVGPQGGGCAFSRMAEMGMRVDWPGETSADGQRPAPANGAQIYESAAQTKTAMLEEQRPCSNDIKPRLL